MAFAAIHIPRFILQSAVRAHPELRVHPETLVSVTEGAPPLERIVAANAAALSRGIEPGQLRSQAEELYESVVFLRRSPVLEQAAHAALLDLGWSCSPRLEDAALDTILLDLSGLAPLFGSERQIAERLIGGAAALDLSAHLAIAANLDTAFYAARGFPGITIIPAGEEAARLGGLPVEVLTPALRDVSPNTGEIPSIGIKIEVPLIKIPLIEILDRWGVRTCAALAALPILELSERLGQQGIRLHELARGASMRSMILAETQTTFEEAMDLDDAVAELEPLLFILGRLLDQLCARLDARALSASAIHVRFDLEPAPRPPIERCSEKTPASDAAAANVYEKTMTLPVPMRDSKLLLTLLRLQLQSNPPPRAIVKVTLSATSAPPRGTQGGLFLPTAPQPEKLELTLARLSHLVGAGNVGAPEIVDTHRPDAFRVIPFSVTHHVASFERRNRKAAPPAASRSSGTLQTALRDFRPPIPAMVQLRQNCPARIRFRGLHGNVIAASGPWRTSGSWWEPASWQCDEWDIEVEFPPAAELTALQLPPIPGHGDSPGSQPLRGLYRIFLDVLRQSWFVRGAYD